MKTALEYNRFRARLAWKAVGSRLPRNYFTGLLANSLTELAVRSFAPIKICREIAGTQDGLESVARAKEKRGEGQFAPSDRLLMACPNFSFVC